MTIASTNIEDNLISNFGFFHHGNEKKLSNSFDRYVISTSEASTNSSILEKHESKSGLSQTTTSLPFTINFDLPSFGPIYRISLQIATGTTIVKDSSPEHYLLLKALVSDYLSGEDDIPGMTKRLGENWTENDVIVLLENLSVYREIFTFQASKEDEDIILNKLAQIRTSNLLEEYNSEDWIWREVISSQRIESVYASRSDFFE